MRKPLWLALSLLGGVFSRLPVALAQAQQLPPLQVSVGTLGQSGDLAMPLQILLLLTLLTFIPAMLIATTSFTRIVIVLSLLRQAIGVQQVPPNQVLIGLALFLTVFIMHPVGERLHTQVIQPYLAQQLTAQAALQQAAEPLREFMLRQTREQDLALFLHVAQAQRPGTPAEVSLVTLIPAFIISELRTAFQIGFMLYLPFLVLDLVISSLLVSMGMMMLPQALISLPFKLMLFVLVDGWGLIISSLVRSFQ
ncbi:MAG: flagellar type III secretion system pore protein FliP [Candidatus Tectimicrobiota bacterium]